MILLDGYCDCCGAWLGVFDWSDKIPKVCLDCLDGQEEQDEEAAECIYTQH